MKWSFIIQQKLKAALLLTGLMAVIILTTLLATHNIQGIGRSTTSIYQDRLMPAIGIVFLSENLYSKRLLIEHYLFSEEKIAPETIKKKLLAHNTTIDSLVQAFEKTYLVREESKSLQDFKDCLKEYALWEQTILNLHETSHKQAGHQLFEHQSRATFQRGITLLNNLVKIQSTVGKELIEDYQSEASLFNVVSTLQIAISIVIGLVVLGLIYNAKMIDRERQPFNLN